MTTTTSRKTTPHNLFDEDLTSVYTLDLPPPNASAFAIQNLDIIGDDEQFMLDAFHQQSVAVEGRTALAQLVGTRIGEMATHSALTVGMTMENIERIEAAAPLGRLRNRFYTFDDKLLDQTSRYVLETNAIAIKTMHEDMRRSPYPPPPQPPPRKRKGLLPSLVEFLVGEP